MIHTYKTFIKIKLTLLSFLVLYATTLNAQNYVTIPDANFVKYLKTHFGACMNGNQLDTSCAAIKVDVSFYLLNNSINDLTGIQYFTNVISLECGYNSIKFLPPLSKKLTYLSCSNNELESLPSLDSTVLTSFVCNNNLLISLPKLPITLCSLECNGNKLTTIPELKNPQFDVLHCSNNEITCLPPLPLNIRSLKLLPNPFKCIPNHIFNMDSTLNTYPVCKNNDPVHNPSACPAAVGISGCVFHDENNNCKKDAGEVMVTNAKLKLYNKSNTLLVTTYTNADGKYGILTELDSVRIELDSLKALFQIKCLFPGNDSILHPALNTPWIENVNFGVTCKPGYDLGVQAVITKGWVFPGLQHQLSVFAGSTSKNMQLNCLKNVGGQVKITLNGPIEYTGVPQGALIPTISANVYTYTVTDFAILDPNAFQLLFKTNTTAGSNDKVFVNVKIISSGSDYDTTNNNYNFCYPVVNSLDPNIKEVYPPDLVNIGYHDWFTYTIHFQNTGNAPAMNIILADTLDKNLDLETFQVLKYSHKNQVTLQNNALEFKFPDIQLADSTSDPEGSMGFVQYRIRPKANLPNGTKIGNRAFIYFDYNSPVITNTTVNHFTTTVTVNENNENREVVIYPNPSSGYFNLELNEKLLNQNLTIEIYNVLGKVVWTGIPTSQTSSIDLNHLSNGIYFVKIQGIGQSFNQRIIKQ